VCVWVCVCGFSLLKEHYTYNTPPPPPRGVLLIFSIIYYNIARRRRFIIIITRQWLYYCYDVFVAVSLAWNFNGKTCAPRKSAWLSAREKSHAPSTTRWFVFIFRFARRRSPSGQVPSVPISNCYRRYVNIIL